MLDTVEQTPYTVPDIESLIFTDYDKSAIKLSAEKRDRQNARRLKNWTGARYVESQAAD